MKRLPEERLPRGERDGGLPEGPCCGCGSTTHCGSWEDPIVTSSPHGLVSPGSFPTGSPPLEALSSREWRPRNSAACPTVLLGVQSLCPGPQLGYSVPGSLHAHRQRLPSPVPGRCIPCPLHPGERPLQGREGHWGRRRENKNWIGKEGSAPPKSGRHQVPDRMQECPRSAGVWGGELILGRAVLPALFCSEDLFPIFCLWG